MAELTSKEAEIYDRQIRLWGVEAQQRLRGARVFLCGLSGLGGEVCKNLVLAGISLTLLDDATVAAAHLGAANFLLDADSLGKNVRGGGAAACGKGRATRNNNVRSHSQLPLSCPIPTLCPTSHSARCPARPGL